MVEVQYSAVRLKLESQISAYQLLGPGQVI